jgi:TonB family protein
MAAHAPHPHYLFAVDFPRLFPQMVGASVIAHIFALITFIMLPRLLPGPPPPLPKEIDVDLSYNLPKGPNIGPIAPTRAQDAARLQNTEGQRPKPKTSADEVKLTKAHTEETNKLSMHDRQRIDAIERLKEKKALQETAGGGGTGQASTTGVLGIYISSLQSQIMSVWSLPGGLPGEYLQKTVVVRIFLGPNGAVIKKVTSQPSGFEPLDRSCDSAILKASPLPPPPTLLADELRTKGILIRFHPSDKQH